MSDMHLYIHLDELPNASAMAGGSENGENEDNKTAKGIQEAAKKIVSYATIKSTADQIITGQISQVELTMGATQYEKRLQAGYNIGKQVWNAVESIAAGAMVGGVAGAVTGLAISGVYQLISYSQRVQMLAKEQNLENVSISMLSIRAGTAGRRGNNK